MNEFDFHRPTNLSEALAALRQSGEGKVMAGGQSLIPIMKLGMAAPHDVVSLADVQGLSGIERRGDALVIGAATTHAAVAASDEVREAIPALAELAGNIGDAQVRNRGTLGGSIAHNDPAADYPAALLALGATVATDRRQLAAADFFTGMFMTALADDEIITGVKFPIPDTAAYEKFANPASKYAIVGVFVAKTGDDVRVAITGAGPAVFRATAFEQALAADFSADALDGLTIPADELQGDLHASAEYRSHLTGVVAKRAVGKTS